MDKFGPRLIGETEKTLNALLARVLDGTGLSEPHWVTLRLASTEPDDLAATVQDRARFADARSLIAELTGRGLVSGNRLTAAGQALLAELLGRIALRETEIWGGLAESDSIVAARALVQVRDRARAVLAR